MQKYKKIEWIVIENSPDERMGEGELKGPNSPSRWTKNIHLAPQIFFLIVQNQLYT